MLKIEPHSHPLIIHFKKTSMYRLLSTVIGLLAFGSSAWSQELRLERTNAVDFSSAGLVVPFEDQLKFTNAQERIASSNKRVAIGREQIALQVGEKIISYHDNIAYKHGRIVEGQRLTRLAGGVETATITYDEQSSIDIMGTDGTAIFYDLLDGSATKFVFLSSDLRQVSEYSPYSQFEYSLISASEEFVAIYSQSGSYADRFKISLLTHSGQLVNEREFPTDGHVSLDLKLDDSGIILLMSNSRHPSSRIYRFDMSLNIAWQKQLEGGTINSNIVRSTASKSIAIATREELISLNFETGVEVWRTSINDLASGMAMKVIDVEYVFDDGYVALSIGNYQKVSRRIANNLLFVIANSDGHAVFVDKISDSSQPVLLVNGSSSFALIKDKDVIVYKMK